MADIGIHEARDRRRVLKTPTGGQVILVLLKAPAGQQIFVARRQLNSARCAR